MPFEVHAFTDKEKLLEYVTAHHVEILLISEHDLEEGCEYPAGQIIVLTDRSSGNGLFPNVCKYQSSSQVMREVMEVYGRQCGGIEIDRGVIIKPPMKIAGVFSPVARCGKTSFALALGQNLARVKPTLYLNFEAGSGMKVLLNGSWERDLSDIIYYIRRGEKNIAARLLPLIREQSPLAEMGAQPKGVFFRPEHVQVDAAVVGVGAKIDAHLLHEGDGVDILDPMDLGVIGQPPVPLVIPGRKQAGALHQDQGDPLLLAQGRDPVQVFHRLLPEGGILQHRRLGQPGVGHRLRAHEVAIVGEFRPRKQVLGVLRREL